MPDIPNRAAVEKKVAAALNTLRGEQLARLKKYLGKPPDPSKVPQKFWDEIEEEDKSKWLLLLLPIAIAGAQGAAKIVGLDLDRKSAEALVLPHVERRAAEVARDSTKTTKSQFGDLIKRLQDAAKGGDGASDGPSVRKGHDSAAEEQAGDDFLDSLDGLFGPTRNEGQAVSETTGANSLGEISAVDKAREDGKVIRVWWVTAGDAGVCPTCAPLDGQEEDLWIEKYPDGPPLHPRCRCFLRIDDTGEWQWKNKKDGGKGPKVKA